MHTCPRERDRKSKKAVTTLPKARASCKLDANFRNIFVCANENAIQ